MSEENNVFMFICYPLLIFRHLSFFWGGSFCFKKIGKKETVSREKNFK